MQVPAPSSNIKNENVPVLAAKELAALAKIAVKRTLPKSMLLVQSGVRSESLFFMHSGKAKVFLKDARGKETILAMLGPGHSASGMALIDNDPCSAGIMTLNPITCYLGASVMTLEPTVCHVIAKADFRNLLARNPDFMMRVMQALRVSLRLADHQIDGLAMMDVYGRVARTLLQLAQPLGHEHVITDQFTREDIANMIGASDETVNQIFKSLANAGHIRLENSRIVLCEKNTGLARG